MRWWGLPLLFVCALSLQCLTQEGTSEACSPSQQWCQSIFFVPTNQTWRGCAQYCSEANFNDLQQICCNSDNCNNEISVSPVSDPYATFLTVFFEGQIRSTFVYTATSNSSIFNMEGSANGGIAFWALDYPKDFVVTYFYIKNDQAKPPGTLNFDGRQPWFDSHFLAAKAKFNLSNSDLDFLQATTTRLKPSLEVFENRKLSSDWRTWAIQSTSNATAENSETRVARVPEQNYPSTPHSITPPDVFTALCPAVVSPISYCPFGDPYDKTQKKINSEVPAGRFGLLSQMSVNPGSFNFLIKAYNGTLPSPQGQNTYSIACGEWQYYTLYIPAYTPMVKLYFEQLECASPDSMCPLATIFTIEQGCPNADVHTRRQVLQHSALVTFNPLNTEDQKIVVAIHADVIWGRFSDGKLRDRNQIPGLNETRCCGVNTSFWNYTVSVELETDRLVVWRSCLFLLLFLFVALILIGAQYWYTLRQGATIYLCPRELNSGVVERPEVVPAPRISLASTPAVTMEMEMAKWQLPSRTQVMDQANLDLANLEATNTSGYHDVPSDVAAARKNSVILGAEEKLFMFASLFYPESHLALSSVLFIVGMLVWTPSFQYALSLSSLDTDFASICHFNNECRLDVELFGWVQIKAFNQVMSNFGYMICGFYTIIYISLDNKLQHHRGFTTRLPQRQLGNFYGIGVAIACEGLFSGVYHVCPTLGNFQFDSIMMFFITGTILLSLFGRRHANTFSQGYFFGCFGGMIVTNMFGVYMYMTGYTRTFWAICLPLVIVAVLVALTHFWYNRVTPFRSFMTFVYVMMGKCGFKNAVAFTGNHYDNMRFVSKMTRDRQFQLFGMILVWIIDVIVISIAAANLLYSSDAFLVLSSINMLFYLGLYLTFKIWAGRNGFPSERLTWDIYVLGIATALIVVVALYIFLIPVTNKALSINHTYDFSAKEGHCVFLYFDLHDIWHLLGAVGLCLLTILVYRLDVSSDLDLAQLHTADLKRLF